LEVLQEFASLYDEGGCKVLWAMKLIPIALCGKVT
jgi:hypothetical protein